ncbi:unnamed protein product [Phaedon cochleariae]|uniref:Uncharacterized protein n=1 Tax=Phaedon cochleariae TaxID=80249 RepID=A0A9P0DJV3_PHACE|nr:unnamed protein product [Phaedon cochleariae]
MWQKYVSLLIFAAAASCFNIDTNFPKVFVDPASTKNKNMKSYFGYSVVMNPMSNTNPVEWIRIGAPIAKNSLGTIDGLVYNCDMNGCEPIELPKSIFRNERIKEKLEHGWIGGTMDISYEFDRMTVCAFHRYYVNGGDFTTMGTCYLSTLNSTTFENMDPLLDPYVPVADKRYYLYGQGQAGFSAHFSNHRGDFIDLVLGAPGVYNWAGTPIKVKYEVINSPPANRRRKKRATNYHKTVAIPDTSETLVDNILFGYAVTSGYFYQDETLYYAASTPKGNDYKGKVVIFEFDSSRAIQGKETKLGEQFGEYFGASIASGKINSDNLDDLVVGAPYFKDKSYNEGRVYVFLSERKDLKMYTVLTGRSTNSQFGSAIMCLGDIDLDGYGDIAIGAPYEDDNTGAIYIYGGSNTGVDKIPRQIILGKQITPEILGFGIIISKAIDMDHNNYKDLAIGAYLSGNAVLLRSRPIVVVHYNLLAAPSVLKLDSTSFLLNICFSYSIHSEETVDIIYEIKVVGRANIFGNETIIRNLVITKGNLTCDSINVTVEESENLSSSIKAVFSYRLNYNSTEKGITYISESVLENKDELCIRCPVLDEYRSNETYKEFDIPFTRDCGDDDICQSNLSISINIAGLGKNEPFVLGSRNNLEVEVVLDNTGENAFGTELQIILPEVTFRQKPARCRNIFTNGSAVICTIDNPLRKNATRILHLDLNLETNLYKFSSAKELQMLFTIVTTSENSKNFVRYGLELRREADIKLFGISEQQSNFLGNSTTGTSDVTHTYKIEKIGVSPLENITVEIEIPHTYVSLQKEVTFIGVYEPISFVGSQPMTCRSELTYASLKRSQTEEENVFGDVRRKRQVEVFKNVSTHNKEDVKINDKEIELTPNKTLYLNSSSEAVKWSSIICEFDMLQESLASIEIRMLFNISAISDLMESKDTILFSTHGKVKIGKTAKSGNRSIDVSTAFVNDVIKKKKVALWIIILSAIAGLLLLALLVYGLIKARFFKRTIREELENMKAAVQEEDAAKKAAEEGQIQEELSPPFESDINSSKEGLCDKDE